MACFALPSDGLKGIAPRPLLRRLRPLIEIGEEVHDSLHKEPSAEYSTGELSPATEGWRSSWTTRCGSASTPASAPLGSRARRFGTADPLPQGRKRRGRPP